MPQRLRIFVSSPTDVPAERLRADLIVDKLSQDYSRFFAIESYRWEHEAMLASKHFQDAIEPPSTFDIVVLILWSRLGTALPEKTAGREYRGIDGRAPVTGTEWEYEEALKVAREKGAPDLLAFRNISPAPVDTRDPASRARSNAQLDALDQFWRRHFADRGVFLAAYDEYRTLEEFAHRLEESLRKLIERRIKSLADSTSGEPIWLGEPFRGLEPYEFEHAPIFFGRDAAVMKATEQLAANARGGRAFLLVSGASGSGKSSLAKAGIMPRLMKPQRISGMAFLRRAVFRPGSEGADVFLGLARVLARSGKEEEVGLPQLTAEGQNPAQLATHLRGGEPGFLFANALGHLTQADRKHGRLLAFENAKLILVIDQLEELFTVTGIGAEDRRLFIKLLISLARSGAVWVIATLRADFWHRAAEIPELTALAEGQGRIDLAAPSPAELAEMIRKPTQAAGLSFEAHPESGLGLDAVLAEDAAAAPGALPLLSFTLYELYQTAKARGEAVLRHASYAALGGLQGAIAKRAEEIVAGLPAPAQAVLPRVLRALATVSDAAGQAPVARAVRLDDLADGGPARIFVDAFISARLLVATSQGGGPATVRLAHEALISRWQRTRDQLAADRHDLETRTAVEREFGRWRQARGSARRLLLLRNPDLANAVDLAKRWGEELNPPLRDFIGRSGRRARLRQRLTTAAAAVFGILAIIATYASFAAFNQREIALRGQVSVLSAEIVRLVATEPPDTRVDPELAVLLGLNLLPRKLNNWIERLVRPYSPESEAALYAATTQLSRERILYQSSAQLGSIGWLPHQNAVLISDSLSLDHQSVVAIDTATGDLIKRFDGFAKFQISSSGRIVLFTDRRLRVTNQDFSVAFETSGNPFSGFIEQALLSSDGNTLFYVQSGTLFKSAMAGHASIRLTDTNSFALSPDEKTVATAGKDGTVSIIDLASGQVVKQKTFLKDNYQSIDHVRFSPSGIYIGLAVGLSAYVWNVAEDKVIGPLIGHRFNITALTFSPDNRLLVTGSVDSTVRLWSVSSGQIDVELAAHQSDISRVQYNADGTILVTASRDGTIRLWDTSGHIIRVLSEHQGWVRDVAFSADSLHLASVADDGKAVLWYAGRGDVRARLGAHWYETDAVYEYSDGVAYSADGALVATIGGTSACIWDARTAGLVQIVDLSTMTSPSFVRFDASGARVFVGGLGSFHLFEMRDGTMVDARSWTVTGTAYDVSILSQRIAMATDRGLTVWNWETQKEVSVDLLDLDELGTKVEFAGDGNEVIVMNGLTVVVIDATSGKRLFTRELTKSETHYSKLNQKGDVLFLFDQKIGLTAWNIRTGEQVFAVDTGGGWSGGIALSPDGLTLALTIARGADYVVEYLHPNTGAKLRPDTIFYRLVRMPSFTPDSRKLLLVANPNVLQVIDPLSGKVLDSFFHVGPSVNELSQYVISPDGREVVTVGGAPDATVWRFLPTGQRLLDCARQALPPDRQQLSAEEEARYAFSSDRNWLTRLAEWLAGAPDDPEGRQCRPGNPWGG